MNKQKTLLQNFIAFNIAKRLATAKKKTLLTVSGGIDSVVMCNLFHQAGFPFAVAHCNFKLRGKESDADENLVKQLAAKYKADFFVKKFDTKEYAAQKNISIQLAARELRYKWFEEIRKENEFNLVATAHHLNDNIETILFNLTKGTGIRGLRGIPVRQKNIVRPLLFASRIEIENYQIEHQLQFREDSSNTDEKYMRNKIRHQIIPLLKEINPALENTLAEKIELFTELEMLYEKEIKKSTAQLFLVRGTDIYIPVLKLKKTKNVSSVLYEYLKAFDFNAEQVKDIIESAEAEPGKQFISPVARIIKDRQFFIVTKLADTNLSVQFINEEDTEVMLGEHKLKLATLIIDVLNSKLETRNPKQVATIDKEKLEFPLVARKWKAGDYFYPFGMKMKKKKLKKFFTDEKIPLHEKENCWVIESNKKIVWVVGYRLDERFKVTAKTTSILKMMIS